MVKEIIATTLLAFSGSTKNMQPKKAYLDKMVGIYNVRNEIDTSYLADFPTDRGTSKSIIWDTSSGYGTSEEDYLYLNPCKYNNKVVYMQYMNLTWYPSDNELYIEMGMYDSSTSYAPECSLYTNEDITDFDTFIQDMYFYIRQPILMDETFTKLFNAVFTQENNLYTRTYTGYYSFNNTLTTVSENAVMFGTVCIGNNMYYGLEANNNSLYTENYDYSTGKYNKSQLTLPFSRSGMSNQWYLTGVKMNIQDYGRWQNYGVFGYVPRTAPDSFSFGDLFFSLADTPIYFIYSIFNWELFGANLFIAFIGLTSFALVLVLFRRFL